MKSLMFLILLLISAQLTSCTHVTYVYITIPCEHMGENQTTEQTDQTDGCFDDCDEVEFLDTHISI